MTRGGLDEDIEGGLRKFLETRKGDSEKIRGGGAPKICILQNQQEIENALQDIFFLSSFLCRIFFPQKSVVFTLTECIYIYIVVIAVMRSNMGLQSLKVIG